MRRADRSAAPRESTVLVVDDEPDIRELLELTFLKMGIGVVVAGSISEAKARLAEMRFDLCLTDMRLPDGEGLELASPLHSAGGVAEWDDLITLRVQITLIEADHLRVVIHSKNHAVG